jgi:AcrR family transcriptional regulator
VRIAPVGEAGPERRLSLTRERVLEAAIDLADREGLDGVSMRRLGQELGVEAMSLYTHVRSKEDLLDGMADAVVGAIPRPAGGEDWKATLRSTILGARGVLARHRWAPRMIETRLAPGPATLGYMDAVVGILREGGFSIDLTHHAMHVLGSRMMGFTQELYDDSEGTDPDAAAAFAREMGDAFPNVAAVALAASHDGGLGPCDDDVEFGFALELILDGLERLRDREAAASAT